MKKKAICLLIAALFTGMASAQSLSNLKDSVSYAVGMSFSAMIKSYDSTLNLETIIKGFKDAFYNKSVFKEEQLHEIIELYAKQQYGIEIEANKKAYLHQYDSLYKLPGIKKSPSGLLYKIEKIGYKRHPKEGDMLSVHYKLSRVEDNQVIDSSYERNDPISFENIDGKTIAGFMEGVRMLREGGKIIIYVPPHLGYGETGTGAIKAYQLLVFEIELLSIDSQKSKKNR